MTATLRAPFPWFGGKSAVAELVWPRLGRAKQYIEPFCGSAAMLLAAPKPASLEVIGDVNLYVANFWRALRAQPDGVWRWSDYPVSHIDLYARHRWLTEPARRTALVAALLDPDWPGDAKVAGWWVWGQCCWIGSGWCERPRADPARERRGEGAAGERAGASDLGQIPHASDAGRGLQANGLVRATSGRSRTRATRGGGDLLSPHRAGALDWLRRLSARLERVRVVHGAWDRCLNNHYGAEETAIFLDPPYRAFESLYAKEGARPVADEVAEWAKSNPGIRIALCGHDGDYELPGWECVAWSRPGNTYGGDGTKDEERIWFSPHCLPVEPRQSSLFAAEARHG